MSKTRLYGQQVMLYMSVDGTNFGERLGEVMNFDAKSDHIVKKHSSLGETGVGAIDVLDDGGTLSFTLDKTDAKFDAFFIGLEDHLRGGGQSGTRGKAPYLVIKDFRRYVDGSIQEIFYEGVVLHNPETSATGRTEVVSDKMQGTYKKRRQAGTDGITGNDATKSIIDGAGFLSDAIANFGKLSANATTDFKEIDSITYYQSPFKV